ncbi:unnamed protein product [Rotaria magnacalcarata]|uniref:Uncharacterized protein n=1 Tax=Rotaria magnacalcarata TaxID=392030 RepID=A0A820GJC3_9BILA|nr:unnamed protein product [Rotaria magnacalcarata]CAF4278388.1 unnamed protein product [Rotaria magnacalcarata]
MPRYDDKLKSFAICLYILGGKTTYEFVWLNLPGSLPNLTTIHSLIQNNDDNVTEGKFRFNKMAKYLNSFGVQHAYCAEDCTGVVRRIKYDTHANSFIGFSTPLSGGVPSPCHFKTDSISELKLWMDKNGQAPLLNIHCVQAIPPPNQTVVPPSFVLAGYGTSSKYTSLDILRRWLFIHKNSIEQNVRILGFSTDADNKYFRAMRLMSGFYASLSNFDVHVDSSMFSIQISNWSWYFLRPEQLFVFMQDATHLVTKLRNRLLSATAALQVGDKCITMKHLQQLLDNEELIRLDHGLTQSDLKPTDRQNFRSCLRITSCDVLNLIARDDNSNGTYMYLKLIKLIITSYIEPTTSIEERLKGAWTAVFLLRLWWVWLLLVRLSSLSSSSTKSRKNCREKYFVTRTAFFSTELNAHYLTYLIILVQQKQLPVELLKKHKLFDMNALSEYLHNHLRLKSKLHDNVQLFENGNDDSDSEFDLDSDDDDDDISSVHNESSSSEAEDDDDDNMGDEQMKTFKTSFDGLNIKDNVPTDQDKSYFKIKINDMNKFLHKSTACYLLTRDNNSLSTDRLTRVIQTSKK